MQDFIHQQFVGCFRGELGDPRENGRRLHGSFELNQENPQ